MKSIENFPLHVDSDLLKRINLFMCEKCLNSTFVSNYYKQQRSATSNQHLEKLDINSDEFEIKTT